MMQPMFWIATAALLGYVGYRVVMMQLGKLFHFIGTTEINDVWDD